jgi:peptidoglycan/xylan/chitin deacetylase (PgdA/CDA1 family)
MKTFLPLFLALLVLASAQTYTAPLPCSGGTYAITIDDAPGPDTTKVLAALKAAKLKATFFLVGANVQAYPALAQQIVAEGHEVANHSWSHPDMSTLTQTQIDTELVMANDIIFQTTGVHPVYFRPPYGASNQLVVNRASAAGLTHMWWTIDTEDYTGITAAAIVHQTSLAQNGGVILYHNWVQNLPSAIQQMAAYWNQFATTNPICAGRLSPTTNLMPVHDWFGQLSYVHAIPW